MSKNVCPVKMILLFSLFIEGCVSMNFIPHEDWLAQPVEFHKINNLRLQIEHLDKISLKNRGEAHITLITPPEFEKLKSKLTINAINTIATQSSIEKAPWLPLCVARGTLNNKPNFTTYYLVIKSEELFSLREKIYNTFIDKGGSALAFDPKHFYPHITIGFTERDLHEQDGVIKDTRNCIYDLTTEEGRKQTQWNAN